MLQLQHWLTLSTYRYTNTRHGDEGQREGVRKGREEGRQPCPHTSGQQGGSLLGTQARVLPAPLEALHSGNGSRRRVKTSGGHLVLSSFDVAAAGTPVYIET